MAEFPSLPLFTDSWVADTKHLSRLERGTYMDLLILMWRTPGCRVPNDDAWLARKMGMTIKEVEKELRPQIVEFCQNDGNWITQKRLLKEFEWCRKKRVTNSGSAKTRWDRDKRNRKRTTADTSERIAPHPTPPHPISEAKASAPPSGARPVYEDSTHELWGEGVPILTQLGVAEKSARSNIGRWLRDSGNDPVKVLSALQRARDQRVIEPIAWVTRALKTNGAPKAGQQGFYSMMGPKKGNTDAGS